MAYRKVELAAMSTLTKLLILFFLLGFVLLPWIVGFVQQRMARRRWKPDRAGKRMLSREELDAIEARDEQPARRTTGEFDC